MTRTRFGFWMVPLALVLGVTAAAGQSAGLFVEDGVGGSSPQAVPAPLALAEFYQVPALSVPKGGVLELEFRSEGQALLIERLRLQEAEDQTEQVVVEVLARDGKLLRKLHRMEGEGRALSMIVRLDGEVVEELSVHDLFSRSRVLREDLPLPRVAESRVELLPQWRDLAPAEVDQKSSCPPSCEAGKQQCAQDEISCLLSCVNSDCDLCQQQYYDCVAAACGCYPQTYVTTDEELVSVTGTGNYRCYGYPGSYYERTKFVSKFTRKRVTINECCQVTNEEILDVWYQTTYCWVLLPGTSCSKTLGSPPFCS